MNIISKIFKLIFVSVCAIFGNYELYGQSSVPMKKITEDTLLTRIVDCNALFTLNNRKIDYLKNKPYIYAEPYFERIYNIKNDFAVFQIIKRKGNRPILYIKMFKPNTCLKKGEVLEFITDKGYRYRMNNYYKPNCDGYLISKIRRKDIKNLTQGEISSIKLLTFHNDYEFNLQFIEAERLKDELQCLKNNHFKFK
ncbi:hypothetical protein [Apibacter sp.]|uniref:hypothetical protein n=1 Tax=Apibacter sp. TaxID=2023709 RepID=UPI0025DA0493|nr:hypothetical protein [Apibacter sp.]MCT6869880.1 hypothetical protein [Apibacter sp.]